MRAGIGVENDMLHFLKRLGARFLNEKQKRLARRFLYTILPNARPQEIAGNGDTIKRINTLNDLDLELKRVDEAFAISDDEGRRVMGQFRYEVDEPLPADPYSPEYRAAQMRIYQAVSGRASYSPDQNERTPFDFESTKNNPFPYSTASPTTVGDQLMAQGFLIRAMNLPPKSRVVEFGAGWGNTTAHLAQMGYAVTCVEVDQAFVDLISYRIGLLEKSITFVRQDMLEFKTDTPYDAALFFESFHHCSDHLRMLRNLHAIVKEDGLVAFAAEPITDFPFPWGLRLDGMSAWAMRKFGWLELGFETSYFLRTLLLFGWLPQRYHSDLAQWTDVIVARKSKWLYAPSEITLPLDEDKTWAPRETDPKFKMRFTAGKSMMSCAKEVKAQAVEFCLSNYAPFDLKVELRAGSSSATFILPKSSLKQIYKIPVRDWQGQVRISSPTWNPAKTVKNDDNRNLGVAVHHFQIIPESTG